MKTRSSLLLAALIALVGTWAHAGIFQLQKGEFTTSTTLTNQANGNLYIDSILVYVQASIAAEVTAKIVDKDDNESIIAATQGTVSDFSSLLITYEGGVQWDQGERLLIETTGAGAHQYRITLDYPE